jgi:Protein of unknown function (DUF1549)/Protein of unknown function (DUF1553)/Planctomycete cytochrome C
MRIARAIVAFLLVGLLVGPIRHARGQATDAAANEFFESKVRPLLVQHCYECHAAASKKVRGGLRLDSKPGWVKGGDSGPAIVPGDLENSLLVMAVKYDDPTLKMPPKGKLPADAIATLTEWVKRGAPDPRATEPVAKADRVIDIEAGKKQWAFQPLLNARPPTVGGEASCRTPIDRFILEKLEAKTLGLNPEADPRTLLRRAYVDLIGLPPSPEDVETFLKDPSSRAFERVVDRLLERPQFGERWARHWLDLARFAESHGFEHDYDRPTAYHYRDFVIEAFNRDLPFDTFVKWQLAGDELAPDDNLALKATGFLAAGTHSTQITANQVEKERYDELDDMTNTTGTAFLGLSVGCARCHDHKYDPIPTSDYYRLISTFTKTVRSEVDLKLDPEGDKKARERYDREHAPYLAALATFEADQLPGRLEQWEKSRATSPGAKPEWVVLDPSKFVAKNGTTFEKQPDGSLKATGKNPDFETYTITAACDLPKITAIKVEALADPALVKGGPGRAANGNFDLTDLKLTIGPRYGIGQTSDSKLINPKASFEQKGLPISATVDADKKSGWAVDPQFGKDHAAVFEFEADVLPDGGATLTFLLDFQGNTGHNIGRLRVSATSAAHPVGLDGDGIPANASPILAKARDSRTSEETRTLLDWYKTIDPEWRARKQAIDDHAKTEPKPKAVKALISTEGLPAVRLHTQGADFLEKTHFLKRGDPNQKLGEATQGFLQVLENSSEKEAHWKPEPPKGWRTSYRRAALASWLTDTDQGAGHLLARVIVNRLWQHHMGRGIVATPSDFGAQGERPSHPELLDWLAGELIRGGWRLKPIHKLIMTSAVYRQSSRIDPNKDAIDPENALCGRWSRRRLEAEVVRDAMLAVSGRLDERMFGPGTLDERMTRRSIYFTVKRSKLIPMMTLFDAPDALQPVAVRPSTTVAPQSLLIMNSPIARDWALGLARRIAPKPGGSFGDAARSAYAITLGRPPTDEECGDATAFMKQQADVYKAAGHGDGVEPALTDFSIVMMGLNEFLYVE